MSSFDESPILSYLSLPDTYSPSPKTDPIAFLLRHLRKLPPHLLSHFASITTPKQRTMIPTIRNRRLKHTASDPAELRFSSAKQTWPNLWQGRFEIEGGKEEEDWARTGFLEGSMKHVGKLGKLLGGYEEEREVGRMRSLRRERPSQGDFIPEEESDSDEDAGDTIVSNIADEEAIETTKASFERLVKEQFIYGLLDSTDYNVVDWDEDLDSDGDREAEEKWFDGEDEGLS